MLSKPVCVCLYVQQDLAGEEVDPQVERLKETVSSLEGVLQRSTAPNLKALEKMRVVKDKYQGVVDGTKCRNTPQYTNCIVATHTSIHQLYSGDTHLNTPTV
jgi:hypothetical protein